VVVGITISRHDLIWSHLRDGITFSNKLDVAQAIFGT
jgi:hypothetical protein